MFHTATNTTTNPVPAAVQRPMAIPTREFTKTSNQLMDQMIPELPIKHAITFYVVRQTHGWQREAYLTTVTKLAKALGRTRPRVSEKLQELVSEGAIIKTKDQQGRGYWLSLAENLQEETCSALEEEGVDNSAPNPSEPVDNLTQDLEGVFPQGNTPLFPQGNTPLFPQGNTQHKGESEGADAESSAKDNRLKINSVKENLSERQDPQPENVDNSPQHQDESAAIINAIIDTMPPSIAAGPSVPKSSLPIHYRGKTQRLPGFPRRPVLPEQDRLDIIQFEEMWYAHVPAEPGLGALKSYIRNTFVPKEAAYIIFQLRRARTNIHGYANKVTRSLHIDGGLKHQH